MAKCSLCGKGGPWTKLSNGMCLNCLGEKFHGVSAEFAEVKKSITPEMQSAVDLEKEINNKKMKLSELQEKISSQQAEIFAKEKALLQLEKNLSVVNDALEMETFSLYTPKYDFTKSDEYKNKLDEIRGHQKEMIKGGNAAKCTIEWTVDGSKAKGKKKTNDTIKMLLRSFNNECDMAVSSVKFSNFDRCESRIDKAYETLNSLGESSKIYIDRRYKTLKIDELHLAHEYQCIKQEEKENLRVLREQEREYARFVKEVEEARKDAEKEKKHYQKALEKVQAQIDACQSADELSNLNEKKDEITGYLNDILAKLEDFDYRQANQRAGYVYIISNVGSFGEGVYKIGMTRRLDPMERVYELGDASVPFNFDVHAMIFSDDAPALEAALHQAFACKRVNMVNNRREYFRVELDKIKEVVLANHDKTVEFTESPDAQQYRETKLMQQIHASS